MPRAPKACGHFGCPIKVTGRTYCDEHEAERQRTMAAKRGTFRQRGYDSQHDREGAKAKARAIATHARCPRCKQPILAGQKLVWGHKVARVYQPAGRASQVEHAHCSAVAQHLNG